MVLGIGEGSIEIFLDRNVLRPGEKVTGHVKLSLAQEKEAKGLRILFYGERKRRKRIERYHEQQISLDGAKTYPAGDHSYPFELVLPDIQRMHDDSGTFVAGLVNFFGNLFDPINSYKWYFDASLDISMSFDISKKLRVKLVR